MSLFWRVGPDGREKPVDWEEACGSSSGSFCFVLGGGPELSQLDMGELERTPAARLSINLAGTGLIRPHFWTAYDPTARFSRSTYLDPGIVKFVHRRRAFDLIPETTWKVCEAPRMYFFQGDRERGFTDFLDARQQRIVDWNDSLVQAIDVLYRLGFRTLFLAGCGMRVHPSGGMQDWAQTRGIEVPAGASLLEFVKTCERAGVQRKELEGLEPVSPYHFPEQKSLRAALGTDAHYFRIAESLRLCRGALNRVGLRLISVTPGSRLNAYFPYMEPTAAMQEVRAACGDPTQEQTEGRYSTVQARLPDCAREMRDFKPLHWPEGEGGRVKRER